MTHSFTAYIIHQNVQKVNMMCIYQRQIICNKKYFFREIMSVYIRVKENRGVLNFSFDNNAFFVVCVIRIKRGKLIQNMPKCGAHYC